MKFLNRTSTLIIAALLLYSASYAQGIAINANGADPDPSAMLDVYSSTKGFLPPRLTTIQRDAILSPASGLVIYNTDTKCIQFYDGSGWRESCGSLTYGVITSLNCATASNNGTLTAGIAASGVSSVITYGGGNGNPHNGQTVASTGVTGLTATLAPGTMANGSGSLTYTITGAPATSGIATFALNIGGQSCNLSFTVIAPSFICGTSTVTFNYKGSSVNYGTVVGANNTCWLDRNLGASQVATSSADANSYGDYFQWGRGIDGHQITSSATTSTLSGNDQPGHGDFITNSVYPFIWRNPNNDNLWQGVSGINNPCPSGYRLPTKAEADAEVASWISQNQAGAFNSPLKVPLSGKRNNGGGFDHVGTGGQGGFWTSTVTGDFAIYLYSSEGVSAPQNGGTDINFRANGRPVRCIRD